jgi:type VI secretion system protein VasG
VVDLIVSRCTELASGGRVIDAILTNTMLPELSIALLDRQMAGEEVATIRVAVKDSGFDYAFGGPAAAPNPEAEAATAEPEPAA